MSSIYDSVESDLEAFRNTYVMSPELWSKVSFSDLDGVDFSGWKSIKFLNDAGELSKDMECIPTGCGGVYAYCIQSNIIPNAGIHIMYVGKAGKTNSENLRARVRSYQKQIRPDFNRGRLHRLFAKWGKYVYAFYLPVSADIKTITELEDRLIAAILPPCNSEIRNPSVKAAVKAFSTN